MNWSYEGTEWRPPKPRTRPGVSSRQGGGPEWRGTGLCFEAQADGVPCACAGGSCDTCQHGREDAGPPAQAPDGRF
jgi:hypothetical protein